MRQHKQNKPRTKTITTTFEKQFENFEQLVHELKGFHPEILNHIFPNEEITTVEDAANLVLGYYECNRPNIIERTNLYCSLYLAANKMFLTTNKFFSIGWRFKYNKDGQIYDLFASIVLTTKEGMEPTEEIAAMFDLATEENGWNQVVRNR